MSSAAASRVFFLGWERCFHTVFSVRVCVADWGKRKPRAKAERCRLGAEGSMSSFGKFFNDSRYTGRCGWFGGVGRQVGRWELVALWLVRLFVYVCLRGRVGEDRTRLVKLEGRGRGLVRCCMLVTCFSRCRPYHDAAYIITMMLFASCQDAANIVMMMMMPTSSCVLASS